jgi:iron complex transport system substrate-binding protein
MRIKNILFVLLTVFLFSCKSEKSSSEKTKSEKFKYAKGFSIEDYGSYKRIIINNAYKNAEKQYEYLLVNRGADIPEHSSDVHIIETPVRKIVVTSSSHIPLLELLHVENTLVGFPNTDFISSPKTRELVKNKKVQELGKSENMNTELLLALQPELVMSFAVDKPNKSFLTIQKMGVPILLNGDWVEETPLGRAEWIKLFGALYHKEKEAKQIFNSIESQYLEAKEIAKKAVSRPTVLSGSIFQDVWYLPAGESFIAQYFKDAQTNYLWAESKGTGSLSLNFENVFIKGQGAEYWIGCSMNKTKNQLINENAHYQKFEAFKENKIFTFANYKGETGGLFYFELGPIQPHIILKDIIHIVHPELLPNYKPVFFKNLK